MQRARNSTQANRFMSFLKSDLIRSFGIGFLAGCAVLFMTMDADQPSGGMVPSAVAAPAR
jgi:hypothetical protein